MPTRRDVLKMSASALAATSLASSTAGADEDEELSAEPYWEARPDHVSLAFEPGVLKTYKPMVVIDHLQYTPNAFYGWVARSTHRDTAIAVYWADYDRQEGLSPFGGALSDSHLGDHEPVIVQFHEDTGQVLGVTYSAYHWLAGRAPTYGIPLYEETHPQFYVVKPWHQYAITAEEGVLDVPVKSLLASTPDYETRYDEWLIADELANALFVGANTNPWSLGTRESWWKDTWTAFGLGYSKYESIAKFYKNFSSIPFTDYGGAAESDEIPEVDD